MVERFDGDEMNIFLSQSIQTQIELEEIADVKRQIITPATSRTIIGIVQDGLIGAYNLTSPNMRIDWKNAMNIVSYTAIDNFNAFKKGKEFTGYELFSMIIPPKINVSKSDLTIKNGVLENGYITKDLLGSKKKNNLTQLIWDEYGIEETKTFLNNTQRLINNFNLFNGFTVGVGDAAITKDVAEQINRLFDTKDLKVCHLLTDLENNPELMDKDLFERTLFAELNNIRGDVGKLMMANIAADNKFNIMISSGSKGDSTNLAQMGGCIGLQAFEGKLVPKKLHNRTIPYFFRDEDSSEARGLIKRPFINGMTFPDFFFHNMTGREGLIDQAIKTSESGYIQRKLVKLMEDYMIKYDGTVRSAVNQIVQFIYGDSGAETTKQYEYVMKFLELGDKEIADKYVFTKDELKRAKITDKENEQYYNLILEMRDRLRISQIKTRMERITLNTTYMLPINLGRIIDSIKNDPKLKSKSSNKDEELDYTYIINKFEEILDNRNTKLMTMKDGDRTNKESVKYRDDRTAKTALFASLIDSLSPKRCIIEYDLSKTQFDLMVQEIINSFNKNMIEPGEMVGVIAAQSLGEPTTQLSIVLGSLIKIIGNNGFYYNGPIEGFVDKLMEDNKDWVIEFKKANENNLTSSVYHPSDDYYIVSVGKDEKIKWKRISEMSRHPANGKLIKVKTRSGKSTIATLSHSFLKRENHKIVPVKGSELIKGMRIPIAKSIPVIENPIMDVDSEGMNIKLDKDFGWLCGVYLADGSISSNTITISKIIPEFEIELKKLCDRFGCDMTIRYKQGNIIIKDFPRKWDEKVYDGKDHIFTHKPLAKFLEKQFGKGSYNKFVDGMIFATNLEFIKGIISGYFDGDGNIQFDKDHQGIRAHSVCANIINDMCILVNYVNMHATKAIEHKKEQINNKSEGKYNVIHIPIKYTCMFKNVIGLRGKEKAEILDKLLAYTQRDNKHSSREDIDMIPGLGQTISDISEKLIMDGHSRLYKRCIKKEAIGRETIGKFIETFKKEIQVQSENNKLEGDELTKANEMELVRRWIKQEKRKQEETKRKLLKEKATKKLDDEDIDDQEKDEEKDEEQEEINIDDYDVEDIKQQINQNVKINKKKIVLKRLTEEEQVEINKQLQILQDAYNSDVVWDEIIDLEILDDPKEYVYDFTVPGLESFMVDTGILVHNTLNSFHHSGVANMVTTTQGVPRVKELLSLTKNLKTPQMIIYLTPNHMGSREMANKIASFIEYTTLGSLRNKLAVYYDPDPYAKGGFIEQDKANKIFTTTSTSKNSCQSDVASLPWLMRIELNREKILEKEVTLGEIKSKICHGWEKRHTDKGIKKEDKQIYDNITQIALLSNTDYDKVPILHIRFDMVNFDITLLNGFIDLMIDNFKLKGISAVTSISAISDERVLTFDGPNHEVEKKNQYVIYTMGTNLYDIRYLNNIDINNTISNDIVAVYETFGIEAARSLLLREIIYAYERAGSGVNFQHVAVLIDMMTFNGTLTSIDRHGMSKTDTGPLSRASFEKTVDILLTAAVFSETDNMNSVSSRIMTGLVIKGGTGYCNVILDTDMIQNSEFTEDIGQKYVKTYNEINKNSVIEDITNQIDNKESEEGGFFIPE